MIAAALLLLFAAAPADTQFEKLSEEAEQARAANRVDHAIDLYARALKVRPTWKEGWWSLGALYYGKDDYSACRTAFSKLTSLENTGGPAWTMLGLCEAGLKQYANALTDLERGRDLGGGTREINDVARYHMARLYIKSEQFEKALAIAGSMIGSGSMDQRLITLGGLGVLRRAQFPDEVPDNDRELIYLAGKTFWSAASKPVADTETEFSRLLAKYPDSPGVHYFYGTFLLLGNTDRAIAEFERELQISPSHAPALAAIAYEYLRRNDADHGLPYAKKAAIMLPDAFGAHALLGRLLVLKGDLDEGLKELETAKRLAPEDAQVRFTLASVYTKLGRVRDAAREREEFKRLQGSEKK